MTTFKEQLPGLTVHINEGRLLGTFDLPPADMQHIRYHGRQVIVIVADAEKVAVADTKDGDTKASWTFKAVDAAIVRDQGMVDHLANVLYLNGLEELDAPRPIGTIPVTLPAKVGIYSDEGQFLGFEDEVPEGVDSATGEVAPAAELEEAIPDSTDVDDEDELSTELIGKSVVPEREIFRTPATTRPIQNKDKLLERFLNDERVGSGL